jgi:TonB family protein
MKPILVFLALFSLTQPVHAQVSANLLAQLKDPLESERTAALTSIGELATPDIAVLEAVAAGLFDEAEGVRVAAAHTLAGVAGKLGCKPDFLVDCKALAGVLDATPKKANRVSPRYPPLARNSGIQGTVKVQFLVRADGSVDRVRVLSGPPPLQDAAADAVRLYRYEPAKRNGRAVLFEMVSTIRFTLK